MRIFMIRTGVSGVAVIVSNAYYLTRGAFAQITHPAHNATNTGMKCRNDYLKNECIL